jgi:predicted MFS family arabinose efflux permease
LQEEKKVIPTPAAEHRARWTALGVFTTIYMLAGFIGMSVAPLSPFIQDELGLSRAELGMFISMLYLGSIFTGYMAGWLSDHWSIHKTLVMGLMLEAILIGGVWKVSLFPAMLALFFVAGFGYGAVNPVTSKGVMIWFPPDRRATAMAIKQMGFTAGSMMASVALPVLAESVGWRCSVLASSVLVLICGAACYLAYPAAAEGGGAMASSATVKRHMPKKNAWTGVVVAWSIVGLFFAALQGAGTAYMAVFMVERFSYSVVAAGVFLAVAQGSGALGRILWGLASDRWFKDNRKTEIAVIGFIAAFMSVLWGLLPQNTPHFIIGVLAGVFGFTAIGYNAVFLTLIGETVGPEKAGQATGLAITIGYFGIIVGPPVFGMIADKTGDYSISWMVYGVALALANCVALIYFRKK